MIKANFKQLNNTIKSQLVLIICGCLSSLLYLYWLKQSTQYAQAELFDLWLIGFATALISFCCWYYYHRIYKHQNRKHQFYNDYRSSQKASLLGILLFALLFRLIGFFVFPILEDDFYRYLWDGRILVEEGSPYGIAPSAYFASDIINDKFGNILSNINYPDVPTIYGPVLQWLFAAAYLIAPGELWPIKLFIMVADIGVIAALLVILKLRHAPYHHLILYAWSPLIIKEFIVSAHPDIIGVFFLLIGIILSYKKNSYWAALFLGLAVSAKIFAFIAVPLLLGFALKRWFFFILTCVVVSWPLGLKAAWLPDGLIAMATHWFFNAPIYALFSNEWFSSFLSFQSIKIILMLSFSLLWVYFFFLKSLNENALTIRGDYLFLLFLLCIPALNSWYLVWLLPFSVIWPTRWAWVASVSILLSYGTGINISTDHIDLYEKIPSLFIIQFLVIVVAMKFDFFDYKKS